MYLKLFDNEWSCSRAISSRIDFDKLSIRTGIGFKYLINRIANQIGYDTLNGF